MRRFVFMCFVVNPDNRHDRNATWTEKRNPTGRWRVCEYKDLVARDKVSLNIFWLKDSSLSESEHLREPDVIAQGIVENLEAASAQFREVATDLGREAVDSGG